MTDEQKDSQSEQNVKDIEQAINNYQSRNLAIGCIGVLVIAICLAIGMWSCVACHSDEPSTSAVSTTAPSSSAGGQSASGSASTGSSSGSTDTQPKQQTQPQQSQSSAQVFRQKIVSLGNTLADLMNKEVEAFGAMDISTSTKINDQAQKAYKDMEALNVPAGYEDIRNAYIEAGHSAASAINYMHFAIGAKQVGDDSLCEYYVNLAQSEQYNAIDALENAANLASALS